MEKTRHDHSRLLALLRETLRALPGTEVAEQLPANGGHVRGQVPTLLLTRDGVTHEIVPVVKRDVFPRDAREYLWQQRQAKRPGAPASNGRIRILAADSISAGAMEILRDEGAAYFESGGSLFLKAGGMYLFLERPAAKRALRVKRSLFAGRRQLVVMKLLLHPGAWFNVAELALLARVSTATTSQTLLLLERFDWLEIAGKGPAKRRRLTAPGAVLDAWAEERRTEPKPDARNYRCLGGIGACAASIAGLCAAHGIEYAFTHSFAARRHMGDDAPVDELYCYLPLDDRSEELLHAAARPAGTGGNLYVWEMPSIPDLLGIVTRADFALAGPIRVYLDLIATAETILADEFRQRYIQY